MVYLCDKGSGSGDMRIRRCTSESDTQLIKKTCGEVVLLAPSQSVIMQCMWDQKPEEEKTKWQGKQRKQETEELRMLSAIRAVTKMRAKALKSMRERAVTKMRAKAV